MIDDNKISQIIKEAIEQVLKQDETTEIGQSQHVVKKFKTKSGKEVEVVIDLDSDGEGEFEYSIDGGDYDYLNGYLRVEDNAVVDFDGCYDLPKAVKITLEKMGISCDF